MIEACEAALFSGPVRVGDRNPSGEVAYAGYARVPVAAERGGWNLTPIEFPPSQQDEPVFVLYVALLDHTGRVIAAREAQESDLKPEPPSTRTQSPTA